MSIFHCESHGHEEDSDYVGCVELDDGRLVCDERAAAVEDAREQEREAFRAMSLSAQREAIGGEFGGDGPDD